MIPAAPRAAPRAELIGSMTRPAELIDAFRRMFPSHTGYGRGGRDRRRRPGRLLPEWSLAGQCPACSATLPASTGVPGVVTRAGRPLGVTFGHH